MSNVRDRYLFSRHLFAVEMGKTKITMNKSVYLGQAKLDLSKTLMHESLRLNDTEIWEQS